MEEVIYYNLADDILRGDVEEKTKKDNCCKPNHRTICVDSRKKVWEAFENPEESSVGIVCKIFLY